MMELFQASSFTLLFPGPTWPKAGSSPAAMNTELGYTEPLSFGWKLKRRYSLSVVDTCLELDPGRIIA